MSAPETPEWTSVPCSQCGKPTEMLTSLLAPVARWNQEEKVKAAREHREPDLITYETLVPCDHCTSARRVEVEDTSRLRRTEAGRALLAMRAGTATGQQLNFLAGNGHAAAVNDYIAVHGFPGAPHVRDRSTDSTD